jgi:hypothetical protein
VDPRYTAFLGSSREPRFDNESNWYYDVGPGIDFNVGRLHFYAEGRYMTIFTKSADPSQENGHAHMFPVYGGLKFY